MFTNPLSTNDLEIESEGYPVQDPLGARLRLGIQPHYEDPSEIRIEN